MPLKLFLKIVCHVFMGRDHCFSVDNCRAELDILGSFCFGRKGIKGLCMISLTIWPIYSLSKSAPLERPLNLSYSFRWSSSRPAGGKLIPKILRRASCYPDIFVCSATIFWAKAFTAGLVAFCSANSLSLISF